MTKLWLIKYITTTQKQFKYIAEILIHENNALIFLCSNLIENTNHLSRAFVSTHATSHNKTGIIYHSCIICLSFASWNQETWKDGDAENTSLIVVIVYNSQDTSAANRKYISWIFCVLRRFTFSLFQLIALSCLEKRKIIELFIKYKL